MTGDGAALVMTGGRELHPQMQPEDRVRLVGVSIPRSGHHHLVRLLRAVLGETLHYCEYYNPVDCCRQVPCSRQTAARVVFQKNHDLDLGLDSRLRGCVYVVQTRSLPLAALSDRELAERVYPELAGDRDELLVWLGKRLAYYRLFWEKWVSGAPGNSVRIRYEDLVSRPAEVLNDLLERIGVRVAPGAVPAAVEQLANRRDGTAKPFAPRRFAPDPAAEPLFSAFAALARDIGGAAVEAGPAAGVEPAVRQALETAASAHAAALSGRLQEAAAAWRRFCERRPEDPCGRVEFSLALSALGRERGALHCALRAVQQEPARSSALKRARDLLAGMGRHREAARLSRKVAERHPDRPAALIDAAVDLYHAGLRAEAAAAARRFVASARAVPWSAGDSAHAQELRSVAHGYNEPSFWESAGHVLLAGGEAELALEAARFALAVAKDRGDLERLIQRARLEAGLGEEGP